MSAMRRKRRRNEYPTPRSRQRDAEPRLLQTPTTSGTPRRHRFSPMAPATGAMPVAVARIQEVARCALKHDDTVEDFVVEAIATALAATNSKEERASIITSFLPTPTSQTLLPAIHALFGDEVNQDESFLPSTSLSGVGGNDAAAMQASLGTINRPVKKSKPKKKHSSIEKSEKLTLDELNSRPVAGRKLCNCQAQTHKLIGNCISCGRVVCEQEGKGPCLFCGALWGAKHDAPNASARFEDAESADAKALAFKDRLVGYDRESAARTKVLDDQSDWFSTSAFLGAEDSAWTTPEERAAAADRRRLIEAAEEEMREKKMELCIDVAGGAAFVKQDTSAMEKLTKTLRDQAAPEAFAMASSGVR